MKKTSKKPLIIAVIPARYASTRFEGKPLAMIMGKPMIQHVYERAVRSGSVDEVVVATDDERIERCVREFGGKVVMTSSSHHTGTDRIAEVARKSTADIIVNVQGDEPLLDPNMIEEVIAPLIKDSEISVVTLASRITDPADFVDLSNVKVVMDPRCNVLFMSRAPIPHPKSREHYCVHKQIGLYAFRREYLIAFAAMRQTPLEVIEGVELLRVIESGHKLRAAITECRTYSVDTPADLAEVIRIMKRMRLPKERRGL